MSGLTDLCDRFRRRHIEQAPLPAMQAALIVCRSGDDAVIVGRTGGPNRRITGDDATSWLAAAEYVFSGDNGLRLLVPADVRDPHPGTASAVGPPLIPQNHHGQDRDRGQQ